MAIGVCKFSERAILRYPCSALPLAALLIDRRRHFILRLGNGYARSTTAASLDQQRQCSPPPPPPPPPKNTRFTTNSLFTLNVIVLRYNVDVSKLNDR